MEPKKIRIPIITRQANFQPDTFNEEKRTVDVVFSTGANSTCTPFD